MTEIDPKLSRLYREASTGDPPAALDAAVLAAARKQVAQRQRRERSQRHGRSQRDARSLWSRWMMPASAIATLVLGVSIALLVERERPDISDDTAIRQIPPRPEIPQAARATESAKPKAADSAAPGAATKREAPGAVAPTQEPAATAPAQTPAATFPAQTRVPRPTAPAPSAAVAFPAENRAKANAPNAAAPKAATESNVAGDSAFGGAGATAPAARAAAPAAPAPAAASAAPAAAGKLAPMRQQAIQPSPEAWLEEISRLKREGREQEAAEQLAEFRNAYPAYAVPQTILR